MIHKHREDADPLHESADKFHRIYIKCLNAQRVDRCVREILFLIVVAVAIATTIGVVLGTNGFHMNVRVSPVEQLLPR